MYRNILVPISFDEDREVDRPLEIARQLADENAKITLLHVVEAIPPYALSYVPTDLLAETRQGMHKELGDLAARLPNAQGEVIDGHSGRSILDWADQHKPDLIVIASHHPAMSDLVFGSTAAQIVRHADCSVHVVR